LNHVSLISAAKITNKKYPAKIWSEHFKIIRNNLANWKELVIFAPNNKGYGHKGKYRNCLLFSASEIEGLHLLQYELAEG
jgi:hypothetical protein